MIDLGELLGTSRGCKMVLQCESLRFDRAALRAALAELSPGDCIAYAIRLNASSVARMVTLVTLPLHLRCVQRMIVRGGAQVLGRYGIDPSLDAPSCVYELNSAAAEYADRCLRPRGSAPRFRRITSHLLGCDPALGGVVVVARKI